MRPTNHNLDDQLRGCTVLIEGRDPCGTGFFVAPHLILTCAHVVEEAKKQEGTVYVTWNEQRCPAQIETLLDRPYPDLALLRAPDLAENHPCVYLQGAVKNGDSLYGWGYPRAYKEGDSLQADYEGPTGTKEWRLKIKGGQVQPGFSGAPLLNLRTGGVCGVIKSTRDEISDLGGWAIPTATALDRLPNLEAMQQEFHHKDRTWARHVPIEMYLAGLQEYCANLPYIALSRMASGRGLPDVYIPLRMKRTVSYTEGNRDLMVATRELVNALDGLDLPDVFEESHKHLVLTGGPGSGKSCLLRYLAANAWQAPEKVGLAGRHLPLVLSSRSLAGAKGSLEDRLCEVLNNGLSMLQNIPIGFLRDWSNDTGQPWLLMLDALDEVPGDDRRRLFDWLNPLLKEMANVRVVITSRPDGDLQKELDSRLFSFYELRSLTREQTSELAQRWLGQEAERFLRETERAELDPMLRDPLMVTLAAMVYAKKGALPARLALLYGESVEILLHEARDRGLDTELGPRVAKVAKGALASLALELTRFPNAPPEKLRQRGAKYLRSALQPISEPEAAADGAALADVLGKHSGLLVRTGDSYDFVHATFREYLSALDVAVRLRRDTKLLRGIVRAKFAKDQQVIQFLLGILSDDPQLVRKLVKGLYSTSHLPRLLRSWCVLGSAWYLRRLFWIWRVEASIVVEFLADCLIQGVAIDERTRAAVLGDLHQLASCREEKKFSLWLLAADKLGRLGQPQPMAAIAGDESLPKAAREGAITWLAVFNCTGELEALCEDPQVNEHYRTYARCLLSSDRQTDSLVRIAGDTSVERGSRLVALSRLVLNGEVEHVVNLERSGAIKDLLHGLGRLMFGTYLYALRRKTRLNTVTQDDLEKLIVLEQCMSRYMIDDVAE